MLYFHHWYFQMAAASRIAIWDLKSQSIRTLEEPNNRLWVMYIILLQNCKLASVLSSSQVILWDLEKDSKNFEFKINGSISCLLELKNNYWKLEPIMVRYKQKFGKQMSN